MEAFKNYLYNLAYPIFGLLSPLIVTPYVSRVLEVDGIGKYSALVAISSYFVAFGSLGLDSYGVCKIACCKDMPVKRTKLFLEIFSLKAVCLFVTIVIYIIYVSLAVRTELRVLYLTQLIALVAAVLDPTWFFQGMSNFKMLAFRNVGARIGSILLTFLLVKQKEDLLIYVVLSTAPSLILDFFLFKELRNYGLKWKRPKGFSMLQHLRPAMSFWLAPLLSALYVFITKIALNYFGGDSELGLFESADKLIRMSLMLVSAFTSAMLPKMCFFNTHNDSVQVRGMNERLLSLVLMLALPLSFGLAGIAQNFIPWFYGQNYEKTGWFLSFYALIIVVLSINEVLRFNILVPSHCEKKVVLAIGIAAVSNVLLSLLLIPRYLGYGACATLMLTETVLSLVMLILAREKVKCSFLLKALCRYGIASVIMWLFICASGRFLSAGIVATFVQIGMGMLIYFCVLALTKDSNLFYLFNTVKHVFVSPRMK